MEKRPFLRRGAGLSKYGGMRFPVTGQSLPKQNGDDPDPTTRSRTRHFRQPDRSPLAPRSRSPSPPLQDHYTHQHHPAFQNEHFMDALDNFDSGAGSADNGETDSGVAVPQLPDDSALASRHPQQKHPVYTAAGRFTDPNSTATDLSYLEAHRRDELSIAERQVFEKMEILFEERSFGSDNSIIQKFLHMDHSVDFLAPLQPPTNTPPDIPDSGFHTSRAGEIEEIAAATTTDSDAIDARETCVFQPYGAAGAKSTKGKTVVDSQDANLSLAASVSTSASKKPEKTDPGVVELLYRHLRKEMASLYMPDTSALNRSNTPTVLEVPDDDAADKENIDSTDRSSLEESVLPLPKLPPTSLRENISTPIRPTEPSPEQPPALGAAELSHIHDLQKALEEAIFETDSARTKYTSLLEELEAERSKFEKERDVFGKFRDAENARLRVHVLRVQKADRAAQGVIKRENCEINELRKKIASLDHDKCEIEAKLCEEKASRREERNKIRRDLTTVRENLDAERKKTDSAQKQVERLENEKIGLKDRLRNLALAKKATEECACCLESAPAPDAEWSERSETLPKQTAPTTGAVRKVRSESALTANGSSLPKRRSALLETQNATKKRVQFNLPDSPRRDVSMQDEGTDTDELPYMSLNRSASYDIIGPSLVPEQLIPTILSAVSTASQLEAMPHTSQLTTLPSGPQLIPGTAVPPTRSARSPDPQEDDEIYEGALPESERTKKPDTEKVKPPRPKVTLRRNLPGMWTELHYDNGTVERKKMQGNKIVERVIHYNNGDRLHQMPNGEKAYFYAAKQLIEVTDRDGKKTTTCLKGVNKLYDDGRCEKALDDGSKVTIDNGIKVREKPDGTKYVVTSTYRSVEKPNGWIWRRYAADGHEELCNPEGLLVQSR